MKVDRCHYSYDGEGDLIGTKTFFCHYPGETSIEQFDLSKVGAVFVNTDTLDETLGGWIDRCGKIVTVEVDGEVLNTTPAVTIDLDGARLFVVVDRFFPHLVNFTGFVKVRVMAEANLPECLRLANTYAMQGRQVLLMPEFTDIGHKEVGEVMMGIYDEVHPLVRVMPPVQFLLGVK